MDAFEKYAQKTALTRGLFDLMADASGARVAKAQRDLNKARKQIADRDNTVVFSTDGNVVNPREITKITRPTMTKRVDDLSTATANMESAREKLMRPSVAIPVGAGLVGIPAAAVGIPLLVRALRRRSAAKAAKARLKKGLIIGGSIGGAGLGLAGLAGLASNN